MTGCLPLVSEIVIPRPDAKLDSTNTIPYSIAYANNYTKAPGGKMLLLHFQGAHLVINGGIPEGARVIEFGYSFLDIVNVVN